jgi:putative phosphoribosyl transferase
MRFRNRTHAGRVLASLLPAYAGCPDALVLGLPRGGIPVAYQVARGLRAPLDVFVVRKLGLPGREELAMGAIASGGVCVLNDEVVDKLNIPAEIIEAVAATERKELARRETAYRGDRPAPVVQGRTVILVDDGLATGATMRAAVAALGRLEPDRLVVAVPVASAETAANLRPEVDDLVCAMTPEPFRAVGLWYEEFTQTSDEEIHALLEWAARAAKAPGGGAGPAPAGDRG